MAAFPFELVSPEKLIFSGEVHQVVVPGTEGDFAVGAGHEKLISALRPGLIVVTDATGQVSRLYVRGGFADVSGTGLTILAERAIPAAEMSDAVFDAEIKATEAEVAAAATDADRIRAAERLAQVGDARRAIAA
jgi:F-type H+-transporting ATPase subunit epsilon